jgi:hypothetical protein
MGHHFLPVSISNFGWHTRSACSVGSSPAPTTSFAPVAQLVERQSRTEYSQDIHSLQEGGCGGERVCLFLFRDEQSSEHRTNNSVVGGSNPSGGTIWLSSLIG